MPIIKSAKKRVKTAEKATVRNAKTRRSLKGAIKNFYKDLEGSKKNAATSFSKAQSELGRAGKKHVIHKNKLARKQRQLAQAAKKANVKPVKIERTKTPVKTAVRKTVAKKVTPKKPAPKKPLKKT